MKLIRNLGAYISKHGDFPRGHLSLVGRALRLLISDGLLSTVRAAISFEEREEQLRLDSFREPTALPEGSTVRLRAEAPSMHSESVDIIVCVHNALEDVTACLHSVCNHTPPPYTLIIVDDGSDSEARDFLQDFAATRGAHLIRNEVALGYTKSANRGLRFSSSQFLVLLNSDTIVTPSWLDRMIKCAQSDESVGLVGPMSNTASWQSIPEVEHNGDWAANELRTDSAVRRMSELVAKYSAQVYPNIVFLNGFCLLIKRGVIDTVGLFDEEFFGEGYGEENDFCLRAAAAGWTMRVADDAYVYHSQSRSYSSGRRKQLSEQAGISLERKHGRRAIVDGLRQTKSNRVLAGVRARARVFEERESFIECGRQRWRGRYISFVLPVKFQGGGSKVILQEAAAMMRMGVCVSIVNLDSHRKAFESAHGNSDVHIKYVPAESDVTKAVEKSDAIVATAWTSALWLKRGKFDGKRLAYYIQDFEPDFYAAGTHEYGRALSTYNDFPADAYFSKTRWTASQVQQAAGINPWVVGPSCDVDLFRPRLTGSVFGNKDAISVAAMVRPSTPRRNAGGTVEVLRALHNRYGRRIRIVVFGTNDSDPLMAGLGLDFPHLNLGVQSSEGLALLFNETDVFLDLSIFQAMGLTAMEAMCCGASTLVPANGGAAEIASDGDVAMVTDTRTTENALGAATKLIEDAIFRASLGRRAIDLMPKYHPEGVAYRILERVFS